MQSVTTSVTDHIATITFSNPPHNALPGHVLSALEQAIGDAGKDDVVRVIILKSAGEKSFCAGASFDELAAISNESEGAKFFMGFANVINACRTCPKLIIGRVHGKAVGGGVGLAAAVDYCIATRYASVKLSELALGIGPFVVGPAVERKMGLSAFSQLAVSATEWQTAHWAKEKGLFNDVFDTIEQLDAYIDHFSRNLAIQSPEAMKALKEIFWTDYAHWDVLLSERATISGRLVLSEFTRKAIADLKAKS